ncbi:hypothetical protein Agub_g7706, partial [Astrephomene gubernaculifera]
ECIGAAVRSHLSLPPRVLPRAPAEAAAGAGREAAGGGRGATGAGGQGRAAAADAEAEALSTAAEEVLQRPAKRRRAGSAGGGGKQSQHPGSKFGNLHEMFASQLAAKQRTQAEARGGRDAADEGGAGAAAAGAAGAGAPADSSGTAGGRRGARGSSDNVAPAAAAAGSAAVVVRFVTGLAPQEGEVVDTSAAGALSQLERFVCQLLPPACPELLLLLAQTAAEWAQRATAGGQGAPPPPPDIPQAEPLPDAAAAARTAACRVCCVVLFAVLRERAGAVLRPRAEAAVGSRAAARGGGAGAGGGGSRRTHVGGDVGGGCVAVSSALSAAVVAILRCVPALTRPLSPAAGSEEVAPGAAAAEVLVQTALCLAACSLGAAATARLHLAGQPQAHAGKEEGMPPPAPPGPLPPLGLQAALTAMERCAKLAAQLAGAGAGREAPSEGRLAAAALLGAAG